MDPNRAHARFGPSTIRYPLSTSPVRDHPPSTISHPPERPLFTETARTDIIAPGPSEIELSARARPLENGALLEKQACLAGEASLLAPTIEGVGTGRAASVRNALPAGDWKG